MSFISYHHLSCPSRAYHVLGKRVLAVKVRIPSIYVIVVVHDAFIKSAPLKHQHNNISVGFKQRLYIFFPLWCLITGHTPGHYSGTTEADHVRIRDSLQG